MFGVGFFTNIRRNLMANSAVRDRRALKHKHFFYLARPLH